MNLSIGNVITNIAVAIGRMTDEEVTDLHNKLCDKKIKNISRRTWDYIDKELDGQDE